MDPLISQPFLYWTVNLAIGLLSLGVVLSFVRLLIGPSIPDRVIAFDVMAAFVIGLLALFAIQTGHALFIDVGLSIAIIVFLATVALARYLEKGAK